MAEHLNLENQKMRIIGIKDIAGIGTKAKEVFENMWYVEKASLNIEIIPSERTGELPF